MSDLAERLRIGWAARPGAAMTKINRLLLESREAAEEIDRMHAALTLALPVLEVAAQRFSGAKEALEAVKAAMEGKT